MHIAIRTDASILIGSGHVMRCLTLADGLRRQGHTATFICRDHVGNLITQIAKAGFDFVVLPAIDHPITGTNPDDYAAWLSVPQHIDADATLAALNFNPDWLVIDHYGIDAEWETAVRPAAGHILVIDDLANRRHDCDVILDQNFIHNAAKRYDGLVPPNCTPLIGPNYALLRDEFQIARKEAAAEQGACRVNVFFGGVDATGETVKFLDAIIDGGFEDCRFDVVVGAKNQRRNRILKLASLHGGVSIHENVEHMAKLFSRATVALGAGGTTVWERCCIGLPMLLVAIADNQVAISREVEQAGAAKYLGRASEISGGDMADALVQLLEDKDRVIGMREAARRLADGNGCERVIAAMTKRVGVAS